MQVAGEAALWGNRLAARAAGAGRLLVAHPEGRAGEHVVLSELGASARGRWQVRCTVLLRGPHPSCGHASFELPAGAGGRWLHHAFVALAVCMLSAGMWVPSPLHQTCMHVLGTCSVVPWL